ncbi:MULTISPECIES: TetR/AcrR family transcriptional regulator [Streptomyces violaceusniger group]|uniref:HTH tetR-type domain-containing protein n=1 Tax=Streptomyces rhizosphaericus TaxID=114699 RepID=A0ABN1RLQ6_9ACTN|nr:MULTISPECIES: TetR/AcrR family transcriptional regulator [Streptomyces violaceusniger group]
MAPIPTEALLDAAAELLDEGGPDAVTLRDVGARAGVSRGAPYGHFADKECLLGAVAAEGWERFSDEIAALRGTPSGRLRGALTALVSIGRRHPHLYRQMFGPPRYLFRGPARGPLASGPGMTVPPCRRDDLGGGVTGSERCRWRR